LLLYQYTITTSATEPASNQQKTKAIHRTSQSAQLSKSAISSHQTLPDIESSDLQIQHSTMPSATPVRAMLRTWARQMTEPHPFARNPVSVKPYPTQYGVMFRMPWFSVGRLLLSGCTMGKYDFAAHTRRGLDRTRRGPSSVGLGIWMRGRLGS
jgi:hypothetical protein